MYGYASCQKSRYFYYRHLSEDLNDLQSTEQNEDRDVVLNSESAVYEKELVFLVKLLKKWDKTINSLLFPFRLASYNGYKMYV